MILQVDLLQAFLAILSVLYVNSVLVDVHLLLEAHPGCINYHTASSALGISFTVIASRADTAMLFELFLRSLGVLAFL